MLRLNPKFSLEVHRQRMPIKDPATLERHIVALRKVSVESADYAQREYGVTQPQVGALEKATEGRYRRLKRSKKVTSATAQQLRKLLE